NGGATSSSCSFLCESEERRER
ncbi:bacterial extracellular solute-binding s, 5 Middle family protein, partial [Vibrio parahaemolyticus AQ3810]